MKFKALISALFATGVALAGIVATVPTAHADTPAVCNTTSAGQICVWYNSTQDAIVGAYYPSITTTAHICIYRADGTNKGCSPDVIVHPGDKLKAYFYNPTCGNQFYAAFRATPGVDGRSRNTTACATSV